MTGLSEFKITTSATGRSGVVIDGVDVSASVEGVMLQAKPGSFPVVTLYHSLGSAEIEGVGIVEVAQPQSDAAAAQSVIRKWLAGIDANALESAVLERSDFGTSPIVEALTILMEWADAH